MGLSRSEHVLPALHRYVLGGVCGGGEICQCVWQRAQLVQGEKEVVGMTGLFDTRYDIGQGAPVAHASLHSVKRLSLVCLGKGHRA